MASAPSQHLSGPMAILCIVNGMIGGLILILPVMALQAGWLLTLIVIVVTGLISYYSCYLCIYHTGNQPDLDQAILNHFWGKKWIKVFYQTCILVTLVLILFLYYELIVIQWIGLAPPYQYHPLNPILNCLLLFTFALIVKYKEFGASLMAYGVVSIAAYLLFVTWVAGSADNDKKGKALPLFQQNGMDLAAALAQAFAIQFFFIPVLKKNKKTRKHKSYLLMAFVLGALAYAYIAFMGSYGILNRTFHGKHGKTQHTIQGYFQDKTWQVNAIQIIYLIHLYSVYPQYLIIAKKRFFSIFDLKESEIGQVNQKELLFMVCVLGLCLLIALIHVSVRQIIQFNGAVIGFFFIYFFPVAIHFKCCFIETDHTTSGCNKDQQAPQSPANLQYVQMLEEDKERKKKQSKIQTQNKIGEYIVTEQHGPNQQTKSTMKVLSTSKCQGQERVVSQSRKICEVVVMVFMLCMGLTILVQGLVQIFKGQVE